jgi:hypothetical protein
MFRTALPPSAEPTDCPKALECDELAKLPRLEVCMTTGELSRRLDAFDAAWAEGRSLSLDRAVDLALSVTAIAPR